MHQNTGISLQFKEISRGSRLPKPRGWRGRPLPYPPIPVWPLAVLLQKHLIHIPARRLHDLVLCHWTCRDFHRSSFMLLLIRTHLNSSFITRSFVVQVTSVNIATSRLKIRSSPFLLVRTTPVHHSNILHRSILSEAAMTLLP
jgi:hypothetical protein